MININKNKRQQKVYCLDKIVGAFILFKHCAEVRKAKKKNKQNLTQVYTLSLTQEKQPAHLVNLLYYSFNTRIAM